MNEIKKILPLRLTLPLLALYLLVSIPGMYNHELWLDEAQHFLIGRDSSTLGSLYQNMRYDGHPRLWNALLYFVTHYISASYAGLQILHLLITTSALFVFLRYAPFSLLMKIMIMSGYYFLFEYNLLSRNYALGILCLFICCRLLDDFRKNRWWIGVMLFLLCNTHLFFAFAAIGIFIYLLPELTGISVLRGSAGTRASISTGSAGTMTSILPGTAGAKQRFLAGSLPVIGLFLAGLFCAIIQTRTPAEDNCYAVKPAEWLSSQNLTFAYTGLVKGWLPIPRIPSERFWNTWLVDSLGTTMRKFLFLFFLFFPAVFLWRQRRTLLFYYSSLLLLLAFLVVTQLSGTRYFGMVYIYFISACWIAGGRLNGAAGGASARIAGSTGTDVFGVANMPGGPVLRAVLKTTLQFVLVVQILVSIYALAQDFSRPFSESRNTVMYIKDHQLDDQEIVVDGYNAGPVLCAYLGKKVFYLDVGSEGSYLYFKKSNFPVPRRSIEQEMSQAYFLQRLDKFILISNREINEKAIRSGGILFQVAPLSNFQRSMILSENYFIYQVTKYI